MEYLQSVANGEPPPPTTAAQLLWIQQQGLPPSNNHSFDLDGILNDDFFAALDERGLGSRFGEGTSGLL